MSLLENVKNSFLFTFALIGETIYRTQVPLYVPLVLLALIYFWPFAIFLTFCLYAGLFRRDWIDRYRRHG
jgi:hypothetical protein